MKNFVFGLMILMSFNAFAQVDLEGDESFWDRTYFGGNFAFQFGTVTFIDVSPLAGYMVNNRLSFGPQIVYQYLNIHGVDAMSIYGGRGFARYNFNPQIFGLLEFETINLPIYRPGFDAPVREWVPGALLGGGFFQPLGKRSGIALTFLYNILFDDLRSPYPRPYIVRVGFNI